MFSLILMVIIGLGVALFSQQNTQTVPLTIGSYFFAGVPVYLLVLVSMLFGLVVAWVLSMMQFVSTALTLHQKDSMISTNEDRLHDLEKEVALLREENARLSHTPRTVKFPEYTPERQSGFFTDIRERFATLHRKEAIG